MCHRTRRDKGRKGGRREREGGRERGRERETKKERETDRDKEVTGHRSQNEVEVQGCAPFRVMRTTSLWCTSVLVNILHVHTCTCV